MSSSVLTATHFTKGTRDPSPHATTIINFDRCSLHWPKARTREAADREVQAPDCSTGGTFPGYASNTAHPFKKPQEQRVYWKLCSLQPCTAWHSQRQKDQMELPSIAGWRGSLGEAAPRPSASADEWPAVTRAEGPLPRSLFAFSQHLAFIGLWSQRLLDFWTPG